MNQRKEGFPHLRCVSARSPFVRLLIDSELTHICLFVHTFHQLLRIKHQLRARCHFGWLVGIEHRTRYPRLFSQRTQNSRWGGSRRSKPMNGKRIRDSYEYYEDSKVGWQAKWDDWEGLYEDVTLSWAITDKTEQTVEKSGGRAFQTEGVINIKAPGCEAVWCVWDLVS